MIQENGPVFNTADSQENIRLNQLRCFQGGRFAIDEASRGSHSSSDGGGAPGAGVRVRRTPRQRGGAAVESVMPSRDTAVRAALAVLRFGAVAVGCIILLHAVAWIAMGYG